MYHAAGLAPDFPELQLSDLADGPGYCILGASGRGKTHLAVAILKAWIETKRAARIIGERWTPNGPQPRHEVSALFITAPDLLLTIRNTIGTFGGNVAEHVRHYSRVRGLILDDLGAEKTTDWSGECLYGILSARINELLPTIVTSNLSLTEIQAGDPRLASRLAGLEVITLAGQDRRLRKR